MNEGDTKVIKVRAGKLLKELTITAERGGKLALKFGFNKSLLAEVKLFAGARWHGFDDNPRKVWTIDDSFRNWFQLEWLQGGKPYQRYDNYLAGNYATWHSDRKLKENQHQLITHGLTVRWGIWAAEMGLGKSLAMIELMENIPELQDFEAHYLGPRSAYKSVERELNKWQAKIRPFMYTYEGYVKEINNWIAGRKAPRVLILDESSKIKTPGAQRSKAAKHVCDSMRAEWGDDCYIILMTGTPAPKTPTNWWHQAECACPGFLKEGNIYKFQDRLCITEEREGMAGGKYKHIVAWKDSALRCSKCGEQRDHDIHSDDAFARANNVKCHDFLGAKNEVAYLSERLQGLVVVQFKKDWTDLPDKQFELIKLKPDAETVRAAKLIVKITPRAAQAALLLRELSDGFQYKKVDSGDLETCPLCCGRKEVKIKIPDKEYEPDTPYEDVKYHDEVITCENCDGTGEVIRYVRETQTFDTPKDKQLIDDLDEMEDIGRVNIWGGFTGSIDRIVDICHTHGWATLRIDGRGFVGSDPNGGHLDSNELLDAMDGSHPQKEALRRKYTKLAVVGHPQAGGMGLNLTASPLHIRYSQCHNGEAESQAIDRGHRYGMDENLGYMIRTYIHLPTDLLVHDSIANKRRLEKITLGDMAECLDGN